MADHDANRDPRRLEDLDYDEQIERLAWLAGRAEGEPSVYGFGQMDALKVFTTLISPLAARFGVDVGTTSHEPTTPDQPLDEFKPEPPHIALGRLPPRGAA